jgi:hypothetical protein
MLKIRYSLFLIAGLLLLSNIKNKKIVYLINFKIDTILGNHIQQIHGLSCYYGGGNSYSAVSCGSTENVYCVVT